MTRKLILASALVLLAALAVVSIERDLPFDVLADDPTAVANLHPLTGVLSSLGVVLWGATAAISLFGGAILRPTSPSAGRFLLCSGLLTFYLMLDDLFLVHEVLAPRYLGIAQNRCYLLLAAVTAAYVGSFRRVILATEYAAFGAALAFFAVSVVCDAILAPWLKPRLGPWESLLEDGAKFLGIVAWATYYVGVSYRFVRERTLRA